MFEDKEEATNHRDQVMETLVGTEEIDTWHVHPVLDGAMVRIPIEDRDAATDALDEAGFGVTELGELGDPGDWFELKVKP